MPLWPDKPQQVTTRCIHSCTTVETMEHRTYGDNEKPTSTTSDAQNDDLVCDGQRNGKLRSLKQQRMSRYRAVEQHAAHQKLESEMGYRKYKVKKKLSAMLKNGGGSRSLQPYPIFPFLSGPSPGSVASCIRGSSASLNA